jgi:hypothetical protein
MRIPVFARGANPSADRPFLRKSESYAAGEVVAGRADYVDEVDHSKGIICRELLYFGAPKNWAPEYDDDNRGWIGNELAGVRFVPPANLQKNPTLPRLQIETLLEAAARWDWQNERPA